jgi:aspartate racemase
MKTIGIIGGTSWESTAIYYELLNKGAKARLGGLHSAKCLIHSFDFHEIAIRQKADDWDTLNVIMADAARKLEAGGAECILIAANTMHLCADAVQAAVSIPLLHMIDGTTDAIHQAGLQRVGLIGTRFTMEKPFWVERAAQNGVEVIVPHQAQRDLIHQVIYDELVLGIVRDESRESYLSIMSDLIERGAQGIVLGCTEVCMLVEPRHSNVPLFDTSGLHVEMALEWALQAESTY